MLSRRFGDMALPCPALWNTLLFPGLVLLHFTPQTVVSAQERLGWGSFSGKFPVWKLSRALLSWNFSLNVVVAKLVFVAGP